MSVRHAAPDLACSDELSEILRAAYLNCRSMPNRDISVLVAGSRYGCFTRQMLRLPVRFT